MSFFAFTLPAYAMTTELDTDASLPVADAAPKVVIPEDLSTDTVSTPSVNDEIQSVVSVDDVVLVPVEEGDVDNGGDVNQPVTNTDDDNAPVQASEGITVTNTSNVNVTTASDTVASDDSDDDTDSNTNSKKKSGSKKSKLKLPQIGGDVMGATIANFQFMGNLAQGMVSEDVKQLQSRLRAEGYFTYPTDTGYFGPITLAAVQAYQAANGIPSTGFVGVLTRTSLNAQ